MIKVIGAASEGKLLVEMEKDDIAKLMGFYYGGAKECPGIKPGLTIQVSHMYEHIKKLQTHGSLQRISADLSAYAEAISKHTDRLEKIFGEAE